METPGTEKAESEALETTAVNAMVLSDMEDFDFDESDIETPDNDDLSIPLISILQNNSPQVVDELAKAGSLWNTVTEESFEAIQAKGAEGILVVPVCRVREYVEWVPRDAGGGYVQAFSPDDPVVIAEKSRTPRGKIRMENGNDLVETVYLYVILVDEELSVTGFACLPLKSTMLKVYKNWMTSVNTYRLPKNAAGKRGRVPMGAHVVRFQTVLQQKDKDKWYNLVIKPAFPATDGRTAMTSSLIGKSHPVFQEGKSLKESVTGGRTKIDDADKPVQSAAPAADDGEDAPF